MEPVSESWTVAAVVDDRGRFQLLNFSAPTLYAVPVTAPGRALLATCSVTDAHVHLFPPRVFAAIWRWFDRHAWPVRYRLEARECARFLLDRGVARIVALPYAHVPGMAAALNRFVTDLAAEDPRILPGATVLPGEPGARAVLDEALGPLGSRAVKIHCHVMCVAPDDPRLDDVYDAAAAHGAPVVIHAGDAPATPGYRCDVKALCTPDALGRALARHPRTTVLVPHLGAERMEEVAALLARHDNLWLDTTMAIAGYLPGAERALAVVRAHPERILYGTDFPNVPYPWDRELEALAGAGLPEPALRAILAGNAARLFPPRQDEGQAE